MKTSLAEKDKYVKLISDGYTYQAIADMYGVSRQRIEQIVHSERLKKYRNSEKYKTSQKKYRETHKEMIKDLQSDWRKKHPNYYKAYRKRIKNMEDISDTTIGYTEEGGN